MTLLHRSGLVSIAVTLATPLASAAACSKITWLDTRTPAGITFIGTAQSRLVRSSWGDVRPANGWPIASVLRRTVNGQVVRTERIGKPWINQLPAGTREVVLVGWSYGADCRPLLRDDTLAWIRPGTRGVYSALLRPKQHWSNGIPTLDVFNMPTAPFTDAINVAVLGRRGREFYRGDLLPTDALLSFAEVLPDRDSLARFPRAAIASILAWGTAHPELAKLEPAKRTLTQLPRRAIREEIQQRQSPLAGTYRIVHRFQGGDSVVFFGRTVLHPTSLVDSRRRSDVASEVFNPVGYYLPTYFARTERGLPTEYQRDDQGYHAVSIEPILVTRDSTMWRGSIDALDQVAAFDRRSSIRSLARQLENADDLRGDDWFFLPGVWTTYPDGRVRYTWTGRRGGRIILQVTAERISRVTARR